LAGSSRHAPLEIRQSCTTGLDQRRTKVRPTNKTPDQQRSGGRGSSSTSPHSAPARSERVSTATWPTRSGEFCVGWGGSIIARSWRTSEGASRAEARDRPLRWEVARFETRWPWWAEASAPDRRAGAPVTAAATKITAQVRTCWGMPNFLEGLGISLLKTPGRGKSIPCLEFAGGCWPAMSERSESNGGGGNCTRNGVLARHYAA